MSTSGGPNLVRDGLVLSLDTANPKIYPPQYSATFNGSTTFISWTYSSALNLGATYTIEGWLYLASVSSTTRYIFQMSVANTANFAIVGIYLVNGVITVETRPTTGGALSSITGGTTLSTNTWYHIAVSNSTNSCKLFVNGVQDASGTISTMAFTPGFTAIGRLTNGAANQGYHDGNISNFRILVGTALYTSNFTPPTVPLTAIANTALLTCHTASFIDSSVNNYTLTNNGSTTILSGGPFSFLNNIVSPLSGETASLVNGALYNVSNKGIITFDGVNDVINVEGNWNPFITGSWTVNAWYKYDSVGGNNPTVVGFQTGSYYILVGTIYNGNIATYYGLGGSLVGGLTVATTASWYNITTTHSPIDAYNAAKKQYINGYLDISTTNSTPIFGYVLPGYRVDLTLGFAQDPLYGTRPLNGKIGCVEIYNRELSADEILQNFNSLKGRFGL
jgi:hypothetical protein